MKPTVSDKNLRDAVEKQFEDDPEIRAEAAQGAAGVTSAESEIVIAP